MWSLRREESVMLFPFCKGYFTPIFLITSSKAHRPDSHSQSITGSLTTRRCQHYSPLCLDAYKYAIQQTDEANLVRNVFNNLLNDNMM